MFTVLTVNLQQQQKKTITVIIFSHCRHQTKYTETQ